MSDDVILAAYHGGLGDNLQFSTLPEMFSKAGKKVYIWSRAYFRNREIYDLVWGANPYILGVKDGAWTAGDTPEIGHRAVNTQCIANWEALHGLEPTNVYPKVYYEPNLISGLENTILIDVSSITRAYDQTKINLAMAKIRDLNPKKTFSFVKFAQNINPPVGFSIAHNGVHRKYAADTEKDIKIDNIFQYCDLIRSCCGIVALHSGASHLSSALKAYNPELKSYCIIDKDVYTYHKDKALFIFDNVEYVVI
tara:strand:- start:1694 stop:2449 length:756 start_codon:yes stop_codon:yes gene_type:complete